MAELSRYHRIHKFPNGATLIYYKHNVNNTTQFLLGFLGGASLDGEIEGTAHFLEHMLIKETPELSKEYLSKVFKDMDTVVNAYTTKDRIMLTADVPNRNLEKVCDLYSKLLFNKSFDAKSIDLERGAINEEINMYGDDCADNSYDNFTDIVLSQIIENWNEIDILGTKESIAKIDESVLREYIDNNFVSENLVISVVSNLEFDEIKNIFEKHFVEKAKSDKTKKITYKKTKYFSPSNYIFKLRNNNQKTVEINVAYMSRKYEKETHLYSYVEYYIFNDFAGRLLKEIRTKRGLAYSTDYRTILLPNNMSLNTFSVLTSKEKVNETLKCLGEIIKDITQNGVTQQELDDCKNMILTREEDRRNNLKTISPEVILKRYLEGTEVFFNNQIHRVKELTLDNVNKYLRDTYTNANIFAMIRGDIDEKSMDTYQIQKTLNSRLAQCYFDYVDNCFKDYATGEKISEKRAFELANGITEQEKWSNMAIVQDTTNIKSNKLDNANIAVATKDVIKNLSFENKISIANQVLEQLGLNLKLAIEQNENGASIEQEADLDEHTEEKTEKKEASSEQEKTEEQAKTENQDELVM